MNKPKIVIRQQDITGTVDVITIALKEKFPKDLIEAIGSLDQCKEAKGVYYGIKSEPKTDEDWAELMEEVISIVDEKYPSADFVKEIKRI
jgi:hypothetical protein